MMKSNILVILYLFCSLSGVIAPPVTQTSTKSPNDIGSEANVVEDEINLEYDRYLKEVVQVLESDPEFRDKLQKAEEAAIRSGKIAHELEYVNHALRTRLDEVKRTEMERLRKYAQKAYELQQGLDTEHLGIQSAPNSEHLDHSNPDTFEVEDLRRLIAKTSKDLAEADKKRREEFKQYEMQKEFEKREKAKSLSEEEKKKFEAKNHDMEEQHKKHDPLHHPISKAQLEEVWEKTDHMENQDFDPKTFFHMHDLDGNGMWDFDEVKALFLKELDKMYQANAPEDDMRERMEEMERMREHVFQEADTNRDGLISYGEFLAQTQKKDFNSDPGWESLDQQQVYTPEEYHNFEMQRQHEIEAMIAGGKLPPHAQYGGYPQQYPPHPQQFQGAPGQGHPQQYQQHPGAGQHQQFQHPPANGQPQQFQPLPPNGQPQQFHPHPAQAQQAQYQAHPQNGQPPQYHAPPQPQYNSQQGQGQPLQYQAAAQPQYNSQQVQGQPVHNQQAPPQPVGNQANPHQGSPEGHIASQQAASLHNAGQQQPPPSPPQPNTNNQGQPGDAIKQV